MRQELRSLFPGSGHGIIMITSSYIKGLVALKSQFFQISAEIYTIMQLNIPLFDR